MLQYIETNGTRMPINFGIRVMASTAETLGITFDGLCQKFDLANPPLADMLELVIKGTVIALNEGARLAGTGKNYTEDEVVDLIDADAALLPELSRMMMQSMQPETLGFSKATSPSPRKDAAAEKRSKTVTP